MAIELSPEQQADYQMSKSVMDEPRSIWQRLTDTIAGRNRAEQATGATTGGLGTIQFTNPLGKALWHFARRRMEPQIVARLEQGPEKLRLTGTTAGWRYPGMSDSAGIYRHLRSVLSNADVRPGEAVVDVPRSLAAGLNPAGVTAHELGGHGFQDLSNQVMRAFPGLQSSEVRMPAELLPHFTESQFMQLGGQVPRVHLADPNAYMDAIRAWSQLRRP